MNALTSSQNKLLVRMLQLKAKGPYEHKNTAMFKCPYHKDSAPSLSINFSTGEWHCFSCGRGGYMTSLCRSRTGKTAQELLGIKDDEFSFHSFLREPTAEETIEDKVKRDSQIEDSLSLVIKGAVKAYYQSPEAVAYLESRGIERREATSMNMKYVEEAYCNGTYFKKRLLVPIYNKKGNLINVEARDVTRHQEAKCLYPAKTIKTMYEWWKLDHTKPLYIVEGLMDLAVLRSDDYFKNSSGIFGTQVTDYQIFLMNQFPEIIHIPDNDEPGMHATVDLKARLSTKYSVLKVGSSFIKDVGDIPSFHITVQKFREAGNFLSEY